MSCLNAQYAKILLYEICISVISVDINVDFKPQYHLVETAMTKYVNEV